MTRSPSSPLDPSTEISSDVLSKLLEDESIPPEWWKGLLSQALRELAPTDVFAYGEYVFGHQPAAHHTELIEFILERLERRENGVILEPRGHAKTTWGNTILLAWLIARNPNIRVGLISNTAKQSNDFSRAIRWTYESSDRHREVFGNLVGPKWTDVEWVQRNSPLAGTKDVTMYSAGAGGAIISKRFDLILCDDILDEENCSTPEQREKVSNWFWKTLKPCLAPGGSVIVLGTRWAEDDLYQELIEEKKWPSLVRGAIYYDEDDRDTRRNPKALWPELWPLDKLEQERADLGSALFACAYMNDISGLMEGNIFRRDWWKDRYFDRLPEGKNYTFRMGVDLASSVKESADWTARVVVAEDEQRNVYVLSVYRDKRETGHRQFVIDGYNAFPNISKITVETNQFQSALVQELLGTTSLPVVGKRADVDKVTRARAVAARYESGKVYHHRSLSGSDFEIELTQFPKGHDDMIDALGYAMEVGARGLVFGSIPR